MSRRFSLRYPMILTVLFGLILNFIPISPAFGDNIGACQGSSTTNTRLSLGGRVITPSTILRASGNQPCGPGENNLNLISLSHTIIVSPNGTPAQNGTALLNAMVSISGNAPSAGNPYLLKLEPGQYDLGNQTLVLVPFVDLEGSGEETTVISSSGNANQATLVAASNSETRFIKINGSGGRQAGVYVPTGVSEVYLTHVTISTTAPFGNVEYALLNRGAVRVDSSTFSVSGGSLNVALFNDNTGSATLLNSALNAWGGNQTYAFANNSGSITVHNDTLNAWGAVTDNIALHNNVGGTATVQNSTLSASGGKNSIAFQNYSDAKVENSSLNTSGATSNYAIYNYNSNKVYVGSSELAGDTASVHIYSGSVTCVASYNGSFVMLGSSC
ncbi:MAG TPA: hypothetical protein VH186_20440 [Chloroflexia bacterium]|nr:hypothetical protein [Chloroflexia bacterium]